MVAILKALLESKLLFYNSAQVGFSISCTNKRQYVCRHPAKENWMKKSHNMLAWLSKMVLAQHFLTASSCC
jgi:hypothetical protein